MGEEAFSKFSIIFREAAKSVQLSAKGFLVGTKRLPSENPKKNCPRYKTALSPKQGEVRFKKRQ
jgi:hypothetical protein